MITTDVLTTPFFSVIMPVYNGQSYVSYAIESVLAQTETDWELVIIDDHSTDQTPEILASYALKDPRVRIVTNRENLRIAKTLNRGIKFAGGIWIVRIDADDFFTPNYLKTLRADYAGQAASLDTFFSSWVKVVDELGEKILNVRLPKAQTIQEMMKIENFLYHPATSFPKQLWEKAGGYPEKNIGMAEDTALWIKFFEAGAKLVMIPKFLVNYRIHYSNLTSIHDAKLSDEAGRRDWKAIRQNREWRISLYLKQKMLKLARTEILQLAWMQKHVSLKNVQYLLLTFLPKSFVYGFMWEFRPRARDFIKSFSAKTIRV